MSYRIAGIDVHKKMLAVVVSDVEVDGEYQFERVRYSSGPEHLRSLAKWLIAATGEEVVMESTARALSVVRWDCFFFLRWKQFQRDWRWRRNSGGLLYD